MTISKKLYCKCPRRGQVLVSVYHGGSKNSLLPKKSGSKNLKISSAGKITVKKGTKKGTYRMKVIVTAAGNAKYEKGSKTVTVKVKVKE